MQYIVFSLRNASMHTQRGSFCVGVPCPQGRLSVSDPLALIDENGEHVKASIEVRHLWHDGSIKWLYITGITSLSLNETRSYFLELIKTDQPHFTNPVKLINSSEQIEISLSNGKTITIEHNKLGAIHLNKEVSTWLAHFNDNEYNPLPLAHSNEFSYEVLRNHCHNVAVKIKHKGQLEIQNKALDIEIESTIFLADGDVLSDITITNPAASLHPNGQWDLGDPSSIYINELSLAVSKQASTLIVNDELKLNAPFTKTVIHQASSGKAHWQSPVHVNAADEVNLAHKGGNVYRNGELELETEQCQPLATFELEDNASLALEAKEFWQHFPSVMTATKNSTFVSILGAKDSEPQELQPGEQITRRITLSAGTLTTFDVTLCNEWFQHSSCLPFAPFNAPKELQQLVNKGIEGDNSFFHKRDAIDEFGWRHFGELYADHEKALAPDTPFFVSHYNNQYDPLCGMLYQWAVTGEQRWKELADNLAKHVANIDVYHTTLDKPEYSGGLFWHTDHYVPAHTATHRTYSKNQPTGVYEDHAGGGGPGGQHCYTNGLLHHYLLTGSTTSKQALLTICGWIEGYYEGDGTLLNALLLVKNAGTEGLKNVKTGQYPLDRGTGNYLQALMDRYAVLNDTSDLKKCAHIIKHTVSPSDDITQRQLSNVEATWFYTVFFQAVCRFIQVKEQLNQNDNDYSYAVYSLTHYVKYMLEHEYAYLDKPDILEFPNETWTGQDLRKLCLFAFAKAYMPALATALEQKKQGLQQHIIERLRNSKESETTRLLCLMMQNMNFDAFEQAASPTTDFLNTLSHGRYIKGNNTEGQSTNGHGPFSANTESLTTFGLRTLRGFSLRKERSQAVKRFPKLQQWLGKP
ncbi:hypothetical protein ACOJR9_13455 [Alteromonas sp. A081]|uniref:RIFT barrel domain-containing protein n=1 Tax=Alteromonas sp. A081 TaxID=3410269 RepID=UPI003B97FAB1